jgi:penicillin amidase
LITAIIKATTKAILFSSWFFLYACHPLSIFKPKAIKNNPEPNLEIRLDKNGHAFIRAPELLGTVYGLGFMHARDRLFQLDITRRAALGRLSEIFGEKTLEQDRKMRLLTYKLDEQMAILSLSDQQLLDAYVRGVNDGAKTRGRSAEHFFVGAHFEPLRPAHVIAMARLQAWVLGGDAMAEINRLTSIRTHTNIITQELLRPTNDRGSAIIKNSKNIQELPQLLMPDYLKNLARSANSYTQQLPPLPTSEGASNAWAISGQITNDNKAILMNDPHLRHSWPSNFYSVTLITPEVKISGVSCIGLPSIVIGATDFIAWGATAAYVNTQDAVLLKLNPENSQSYFVDNKLYNLEPWEQEFCIKNNSQCKKEIFYTSIFGPLINLGQEAFALQWTGFLTNYHTDIITPFITLAKARSVSDAVTAAHSMTLPGINLVFADSTQNIGFAYAGLVPQRDAMQAALLPLDGAKKASLWAGVLPATQKAQLINPEKKYIITANQNTFEAYSLAKHSYGQQAIAPYRAIQIENRIQNYLATNQMGFDNLSTIQLDDLSLEAKELSPILGKACAGVFKNADASRREFARLLSTFDGRFSTDSKAALPFTELMQVLVEQKLGSSGHLSLISYKISDYLTKNSHVNLDDFIQPACEPAFQRVVDKASLALWKWRWGRHHYLQRQSPLAQAPLIGAFFKDKKREVGGYASSPLAESGTPVINGANLRFQVKMSSPPEIRLVIDSGNSGVVGHKNSYDQASLWHEGKTLTLSNSWLEKKDASFAIELNYSSSSSSIK